MDVGVSEALFPAEDCGAPEAPLAADAAVAAGAVAGAAVATGAELSAVPEDTMAGEVWLPSLLESP